MESSFYVGLFDSTFTWRSISVESIYLGGKESIEIVSIDQAGEVINDSSPVSSGLTSQVSWPEQNVTSSDSTCCHIA